MHEKSCSHPCDPGNLNPACNDPPITHIQLRAWLFVEIIPFKKMETLNFCNDVKHLQLFLTGQWRLLCCIVTVATPKVSVNVAGQTRAALNEN